MPGAWNGRARAGVPIPGCSWMTGFNEPRTSVTTAVRGGALPASHTHEELPRGPRNGIREVSGKQSRERLE